VSLGFFYDDSHVFLVTNKKFDEVFKWQGVVKPLWVFLVDARPWWESTLLENIVDFSAILIWIRTHRVNRPTILWNEVWQHCQRK